MKNIQERMKKRRDRYVVGYMGRGNMVYCRRPNRYGCDSENGGDPMSLTAARRMLKEMPCDDCAIFELVPLEINK